MKQLSLLLVSLLLAAGAHAQFSSDDETIVPLTIDPSAIAATDHWFAKVMTTERPLGEAGADLGNFIGGTWGHVLMAAAVWQEGDRVSPDFTREIGQAVLMNTLLTGAAKRLIGRRRPDDTNDTSWPSGHTSSTVAALTVLEEHLGGGTLARLPLVAIGATVALSRVQHNRHWLSDTVAGAALGYACGRAACGEVSDDTLAITAGLVLALGALVRDADADPAATHSPHPAVASGSAPLAATLTLWSTEF